ncbi:PDZK1-interacting protein 1 [Hyperolius riggenbachi]|uniref:PDZK1-interacting protein 1 n=1 Tax=Hyperolius riggenbachi TaxID=752182 RepID=UPI0035A3BB04
MMPSWLCFLLLASLGPVSCQSDVNKEARRIPQWGTGLIAVAVFLFLVFVLYMTNKYWKKRPESNHFSLEKTENSVVSNGSTGHYATRISMSPEQVQHVYENPIQVRDDEVSTPM